MDLLDKCPPGYERKNGVCILRNNQRTKRLIANIFGDVDLDDDPFEEEQKDEDDQTAGLDDGGDDDTPVILPPLPPPEPEPEPEPEPRPDPTPAPNPQVRRKPEKGNAASDIIKGVVFSASTPDYDNIDPIDNKRKPKPYHERGPHGSTTDAIYDDTPATGLNAAQITEIAAGAVGVLSGGAGVGLLAGTAQAALPEVGGEVGLELTETTALLAEQAAASAAAATGESAAAAVASTAAADAAVAAGGAAAGEGVGLLGGATAAAAATGVGEAAAVGGAAAATDGVVAGLLAGAAASGAETFGVGLVVLGGAALAVAGTAAVIDHSDEIGNSFNDLENEISKTRDSIF